MASRAESAVATSPGSCPNRIRREVPSEFLGIIWMVIFWIIWMVILWLFYGYSSFGWLFFGEKLWINPPFSQQNEAGMSPTIVIQCYPQDFRLADRKPEIFNNPWFI